MTLKLSSASFLFDAGKFFDLCVKLFYLCCVIVYVNFYYHFMASFLFAPGSDIICLKLSSASFDVMKLDSSCLIKVYFHTCVFMASLACFS